MSPLQSVSTYLGVANIYLLYCYLLLTFTDFSLTYCGILFMFQYSLQYRLDLLSTTGGIISLFPLFF